MNIRQALNSAKAKLADADSLSGSQNEAVILLSFILNKDKSYIYAHLDDEIDDRDLDRFDAAVRDRSAGMPVQYVTGRQEFMSLDFHVNNKVLIPRPETEILVEAVIRRCNKRLYADKPDTVDILDIGTGSGCIAISLAHYIRQSRVTATDISAEALEVAEDNARRLGVRDRIRFIRSDLFECFTDGGTGEGHGIGEQRGKKFDIIVSNPPYIPTGQIGRLQREIRDYEPLKALDGGNDGLAYVRRIIDNAFLYLNRGGALFIEVGHDQAQMIYGEPEIAKLYSTKHIIKDLNGIDRVVVCSITE